VSGALNVATREAAMRIAGHMGSADEETSAETTEPMARATTDVVMLGPALEVMGGIASVERLIMSAVPPHIRIRQIPTMRDGSALTKVLTFAGALMKFVRCLRQKPDVVHVHFASGASNKRKMVLAALAQRRGMNVVLHAHGGYYPKYWERMGKREKALAGKAFRNAKALIVLGEGWRDFFASIGVPRSKILVLPNPVAMPAHVPDRIPTDEVRAVYLGLMNRPKGTFDLLEAVGRLPDATRERLHLVIAGNGETQAVRAAVEKQGLQRCIEVRGWQNVEQRDALLAQSEIFLLPSHWEGLPMAMLEAMAWGLAPICTSVGSIGEVIQSEHNGLLVNARDTAALAAALQRLIEDPETRARIAARARESVESLSIDRYVARLASIYTAAAANRPAAEIA
jgi:glycosyltransferase involved in cell wall biosynthesis